jgi:hypothetical protein
MHGEALNVNRYNHLFDIDKVELEIKKTSDSEYKRIIGDSTEAIISEGGRLGEAVINHANPVDKINWMSNGINSNAYNGDTIGANARNPWDDYYFIDFKTRLHKNDVLTPAESHLFADNPSNARYNDGNYDFRVKETSASNGIEYDAERQITIDNFQPFITQFNLKQGAELKHQLQRIQQDPSGNNNGNVLIKKSKEDNSTL